jgi:PAS domain S-box-containing protein/putative nucleotidyltransferase with HDIG domain
MDNTLRVLLIDDSEDDALLIVRELRRGGFAPVHERVDQASAMRRALSTQTFDLILSDYNMPCFSLPEALHILREFDPDMPLVIVSGAIGEENAVQMMKDGAHDYVMKDHLSRLVPVVQRELREASDRKLRRTVEDQYRKSNFIVNVSSDLMALINHRLQFELVNESFAQAFGKTADDLIGRTAGEFFSETTDRRSVLDIISRCLEGETIRQEIWIQLPEQGQQCFEVSSFPYQETGPFVSHAVLVMHPIAARKRMEMELQQSNQKLQKTLEETVLALSTVVEMRDPYTAGHQNRVASIAAAIGRAMKLPDDQIHGIWVTALIHDIGKICVPSEILCKPGRITPIEFALIQEHAQTGFEILKSIEFPWPVAEIVHQHHERINGSGYPGGLQGDEILLESRILGVADVIEAMTFRRPYREALGLEAALDEIVQKKGILYDPAVVDACLRLDFKFLDAGEF